MKLTTLCLILLSLMQLEAKNTIIESSELDPSSFYEQFEYDSLIHSPWKVSRAKKFDQGRDEIVQYTGEWAIETSTKYPASLQDKGLVMKSKASHYAISRKLETPINNIDQDLVVQYEIKFQNGCACSGAYIKLLDKTSLENYSFFNSETPYQIMFGPDKCGNENQIHFILRKQLPNGIIEEKKLKETPLARTNELTNLYTFVLRKNSDFEIRINGEIAKAGNLVQNSNQFDPSFNPIEEIIDENDIKPIDWDDREYIPDPKSVKPIDYDEKYSSPTIPDPNAVKPENWNESEPLYVRDSNSTSDELILNPKCSTGCGPWSPPRIPNLDYKGPWFQEQIPNPNYQGVWKPRKIKNPDYYELENPAQLNKPIGGIGFELWSMDSGIMFDNIYLGNSVEEAELIGNQTFKIKQNLEHENRKRFRPKVKHEPISPPLNFDEIIKDNEIPNYVQFFHFFKLFWLKQYLDFKDFWFDFLKNPVRVVTHSPFKSLFHSGVIMVSFTTLCGFGSVLLFLFHSGGSSSFNSGIDDEEDGDDNVEFHENTNTNGKDLNGKLKDEKVVVKIEVIEE